MPATEQTWRSLSRMHKLFGISSLVLLVATIWMFAKDHDDEWKEYQRTFRGMEVTQTRWDEARAQAQRSQDAYDKAAAELLAAQSGRPAQSLVENFKTEVRLDIYHRELPPAKDPNATTQQRYDAATPQQRQRVDQLVADALKPIDEAYKAIPEPPAGGFKSTNDESAWRHKAKPLRDEFLKVLGTYIAQAKFLEDKYLDDRKMTSANLDAVKSEFDLAIRDNLSTGPAKQRVALVEAQLRQLTANYQHSAAHRAKLRSILDQITEDERVARAKLDVVEADLKQIGATLDERKAQWFEGPWLGKKWLEAPILDAFNSPLKIDNLWTEGLTHRMYNFKPVTRYDRCTTCHRAMERTFEGQPQYQPRQTLLFTLATPSADEFKEIKAKAAASKDKKAPSLDDVYGLNLAAEGLLNPDDVTINFIRNGSRAIQATLAENPANVQYVARDQVTQSLSAAVTEDSQRPLFGLMIADVIEEINGNRVLSADDARRMLLETVSWGKPIQLTIRRGYPEPYVTHPRLDLFVGSTSPHKLQVLGCTSCHEGQGSATSFKWASHYPNSLKERGEWSKEHGWFDNHHWIYPMYPDRFVEATCLKCHHEVVELEPSERFPEAPAPTVMAGYENIRRFGCFGCHEVVGFDGPSKRVGPDLRLEPNYYAAGLQLAHMAQQRETKLTERAAELKKQVEEAGESAPQPLKDELEATEGNLAVLRQAQELGQELGGATYNDRIRRRLKEILDHDQDELRHYQDAIAAGQVVQKTYHPAFDPAAYETAMVLKDDETPGKFRKVGPSLRYVAAKLDAAFLEDWIREPKHFRPSTMMPQFFQMYDHISGDTAKETEKMQSHSADLEQVEIDGLQTYLLHYSQPFEPLADDAEAAAKQPGDAARGKVVFELGGCLACHSNADFPGQGDQGPDLTGLGDKLVGEKGRAWLYGWIKNPKRYHARTKMPVVPLKATLAKADAEGPKPEETDPIADVAAYLLSSKTNWKPLNTHGRPVTNTNVDRLNELSLEYLAKTFFRSVADEYLATGIPESRRSTLKGAELELLVPDADFDAGKPLSPEQKLRYIGARSVGKYGCYGCHDIPGFEGSKPIGTTLSDWGRKDPSRLAFEHIDHYVGHGGHENAAHGHGHAAGEHAHEADASSSGSDHAHGAGDADHEHAAGEEHAEDAHDSHAHAPAAAEEGPDDFYEHELHHHSRVGFIYQKLREPRSFDYKKTQAKPFNDRLRMPKFPFSNRQREEVITFVLGLVADPPNAQFVYRPSPRQKAINEGRVVLEQFNCAGCHELDREKWELSLPANWDKVNAPPAPTTFPFLVPHFTSPELLASQETTRSGRVKVTVAGRIKRTGSGQLDAYAFDAEEGDYLPLGELEAEKFNRNALAYKFELYEPVLLQGQLFMPKDPLPTLPLSMLEKRHAAHGGDLANYLLPRVIQRYNERMGVEKGEEAWGWVPPTLVGEGSKVQPEWLHAFLLDPYPIRPAVFLNMPKFNMSPDEATRLVDYFAAKDNAAYPFEFEQRTRTSHLATLEQKYKAAFEQLAPDEKAKFKGARFDDAMRIVTSQAGCVKCHSIGDYVSQGDPQAKGPNLSNVYQRLRPGYVRRWVAYPFYTLPYTSMPEYVKYNGGFLDALPDKSLVPVFHGTSTEQLDALIDLLMNLDKYSESKNSITKLVPPPPAAEEPPAGEAAPAAGTPEAGAAEGGAAP